MIDGFDANSLIGTCLMFGAVTVFGLIRAAIYPSQKALDSWMIDHGLSSRAHTRPLIASYLKRTRWIRTIGFLVGWNVPFAWMWITRSARRMDELGTHWGVIGLAAGIILAELIRPRGSGASVSLETRRLDQYLPAFTRIDGWILAGTAALLAVAGALLPVAGAAPPNDSVVARNGVPWYLTMCFTVAAVLVATRAIQESIVRRRQSFDDVEDAHADDAMRSASIQGLAGLSYFGPMWIEAIMAWDLGLTTNGPISGFLNLLALLLSLAGLGMLLGFPRLNARWIVPRAREA
jgi:hypothetical protein